ncbi:hypothetical protein Tco_0902878 [Tanacetum coccineum]
MIRVGPMKIDAVNKIREMLLDFGTYLELVLLWYASFVGAVTTWFPYGGYDMLISWVPVPLDHFPVNALTSKVFSFMVKKGKHFSGKVTPLFSHMLVQPTNDEGEQSERPSEPQPTPSPPHRSEVQVEPQSDPSPRPSQHQHS